MPRYKKKPVEVEAVKLTQKVTIETLEGTMVGEPGDWFITGVEGEHYPCKDSVFQQIYDLVEDEKEDENYQAVG